MDSNSDIEKRPDHDLKPVTKTYDVDVAAQLTAGKVIAIDPEEAARIRRKIDWHLMPLMCSELYGCNNSTEHLELNECHCRMQFADKTTLGQSAVLGILKDDNINAAKFNLLSTIFYVFFLIFEWPQNIALQYLPVGKWMSVNIFVWSVALLCHAAATNFGGLFACRVFLGICEGAITPGFMIVTSMFYTRKEQSQRVGYWCNDVFPKTVVEHADAISFGCSLNEWFCYYPTRAHRIWHATHQDNCSSPVAMADGNHWHYYFHRLDPLLNRRVLPGPKNLAILLYRRDIVSPIRRPAEITCLMRILRNVTNSLSNQRQIIVAGFGYTPGQTTLLGCVDGAVEIIVILCTVTSATYWKNGRAYSAALAYCVAILGGSSSTSCHLKTGSACCSRTGSQVRVPLDFLVHPLVLTYPLRAVVTSIAPFVVTLGWVASTTAGHTKRLTANAIVMVGYAVGNSAGPQYWKAQYQPRDHVPWTILAVCWAVSGILLLVLRFYLARENAKRDREEHDSAYDDVYITQENEDGTTTEKKVDKAFLDLTDRMNRDYRYVL
ncbi:putative transporter PB10D8.01 [Grifola frondosa]|uniref:Putative transporter PB10D8.01 n=1 Tax=Grifola frondosa TaxID=5627 RepID=A0A1C7MGN7_GRIFR|nr:putative transporter PB10D8.01 [Grifola frondosa]